VNWRNKISSLVFTVLVVVIGCSKSNTNNTVPTATNPTAGATTDIPTNGMTPNPNVPDLTLAVPIDLVDKTNYTGLNGISDNQLNLPLVGDPLAFVRTTQITLAYEDQVGLWYAIIPTFTPTQNVTSSIFDTVYADEDLGVRVIAGISNGQLSGYIYYRNRQSGETQCEVIEETCTPPNTPGCITPDVKTPCLQWLDPSDTADVHQLGSFSQGWPVQ